MTQGQYCHSCGKFHHYSHTCCFQNAVVFSGSSDSDYYDSSSSAVDCTLSLGTPSTRRSTTSCNSIPKTSSYNNVIPFSVNSVKFNGGGDVLVARRCTNCDTTSTPLWRNGPRGPKSLCNACGIRLKKEERKRTWSCRRVRDVSNSNVVDIGSGSGSGSGSGPTTLITPDQYGHHSTHNTYHNINATTHHEDQEHGSSIHRLPCNYLTNEFNFIDLYDAREYYQRDPVDGVNRLPFNTTTLVSDFTT